MKQSQFNNYKKIYNLFFILLIFLLLFIAFLLIYIFNEKLLTGRTPSVLNEYSLSEGKNELTNELGSGSGSGWSYNNGVILSNSEYYSPILKANFLNSDEYVVWGELYPVFDNYDNILKNSDFDLIENQKPAYWLFTDVENVTYSVETVNNNKHLTISFNSVNFSKSKVLKYNETLKLERGYYVFFYNYKCDKDFIKSGLFYALLSFSNSKGKEDNKVLNTACGSEGIVKKNSFSGWRYSSIFFFYIPENTNISIYFSFERLNKYLNEKINGNFYLDNVTLLQVDPVISVKGLSSSSCCDIGNFYASREQILVPIHNKYLAVDENSMQTSPINIKKHSSSNLRDFLETPFGTGWKYGVLHIASNSFNNKQIRLKKISLFSYPGINFYIPTNNLRDVVGYENLTRFKGKINIDGENLKYSNDKIAKLNGVEFNFFGDCIDNNSVMQGIVKRLKYHGVNLAKITFWGGVYSISANGTLIQSRAQCFDKYIKEFEDNGFYIYLRLIPGWIFRRFKYIKKRYGSVNDAYIKELFGNFSDFEYFYNEQDSSFTLAIYSNDSQLITFLKNTLAYSLNHHNKYSGKSYKDDDYIAFVEIFNEYALIRDWLNGELAYKSKALSQYYKDRYDELWRDWLRRKYITFNNLVNSWNDSTGIALEEGETNFSNIMRYPDFYDYKAWNNPFSNKRTSDLYLFYAELKIGVEEELAKYIKSELHADKVIVGDSKNDDYYRARLIQFSNYLDAISTHGYYDCCPEDYNGVRSFVQNTNPFNPENYKFFKLNFFSVSASPSIKDKPHFVTEYNWPLTSSHYFLGIPLSMSYFNFQGYPLVVLHNMVQYIENGKHIVDRIPPKSVFSVPNNPIPLLQLSALSIAFLNNYISEGNPLYVRVSEEFLKNKGILLSRNLGALILNKTFIDPLYLMKHKIVYDFSSSITDSEDFMEFKKQIQSNSNELIFDYINKIFKVIAEKILIVSGEIGSKQISLGNFLININYPKHGSIILVSLDNKSIKNSKRLLLVLTSRARNYGMLSDISGRYFESWGKEPLIINYFDGNLKINVNSSLNYAEIYPLDNYGKREKNISYEITNYSNYKQLSFSFSNSPWYEINLFYAGNNASNQNNQTNTTTQTGFENQTNTTTQNQQAGTQRASCIPNWSCSNWSNCENGKQFRTCKDLNNCNNISNKPKEQRSCSNLLSSINKNKKQIVSTILIISFLSILSFVVVRLRNERQRGLKNYLFELADYINRARQYGYSDKQIYNILIDVGWSTYLIKKGFSIADKMASGID